MEVVYLLYHIKDKIPKKISRQQFMFANCDIILFVAGFLTFNGSFAVCNFN